MTEPANIDPKYTPVLYQIQKDIGVRRENGSLKLQKLNRRHKQIIAMHLSGMEGTLIAATLGISYMTVTRTLNDPLAIEFMTEFDNQTRKEFDALRVRANAVIRDGMSHTDINVRLRASDQWARRAGEYQPKKDTAAETAEDVIQRMLNLQINVNVER